MSTEEDVRFGDVFEPYGAADGRLRYMFIEYSESSDPKSGQWWHALDMERGTVDTDRVGFEQRWKDSFTGVEEPFWRKVEE